MRNDEKNIKKDKLGIAVKDGKKNKKTKKMAKDVRKSASITHTKYPWQYEKRRQMFRKKNKRLKRYSTSGEKRTWSPHKENDEIMEQQQKIKKRTRTTRDEKIHQKSIKRFKY